MIKKLSLKFVLVFLVLVVSVFITSACYASESYTYGDFDITIDKTAKTLTVVNNKYNKTKTYDISYGLDNYINYYFQVNDYIADTSSYSEFYNFGLVFANDFSWYTLTSDSSTTYIYCHSNSYCYYFNFFGNSNKFYFGAPWTAGGFAESSSYYKRGAYQLSLNSNFEYTYSSNTVILTSSHRITAPNSIVLYSPKADTSFDYSFEGVKRGQVKLSIENLNSDLRMYGYVGLDKTFSIGDTLDITSNASNLRLLASRTDHSDLYCYLYEGEELNYYIVDENNVILDTGYISEMAKGYFLYGFKVNDGVDFVFLKDGQVYWDNNLTFKYKNGNSNTIQNNDIVSMGQYSYIETNKTVASGTYTGYVYDVNGSLLSEAKCNYSNNLSSLAIEVDTSYHENNVGWNKSCYWLHTIYLTGNNIDGTSRDFSNYSVRWSIPTWLILDSLEVNGQSYDKRSGILTGFTSNGVLSLFNLKIYELIKNHKSSFDITLQVYDSDDNLVLTHIINSDDIVQNQVSSEENNVDKGDYEIVDNPNYSGGSNSNNIGDINNIQNWTADDYLNLMSTDNFVWEFFKAILGNLPWWITTPLTILIFGVVIITIIRFARGA